MNEDEIPTTAAEMRALAEEAEAEAAEAEALAAAARARARAIQLRRKAELVEAATVEVPKETPAKAKPEEPEQDATEAAEDVEATEQDEADAQSDGEPEDIETAVEAESVETEESPEDAAEEPEAETTSGDVVAEKRGRFRRLRRRPKWSTIATAVAVLVIIAALSGSGYMIKEHRDAVRQRQRAAEFAAAARQGVVTLTTADFNNAKQSVQRILDNATGSFKDDMLKTADDFVKVIEQAKVVEQGTVQAVAVDQGTMTNDSAEVLVATTSEVTNAAGAKQEPRTYRLIVTVTRDGGQLKISKVEFVP